VKRSHQFAVDDLVRVCDGPFASFRGVVKAVDEVQSQLSVAVMIYGRVAPAELAFSQVKKV
jgi:transcription termination/antitermination protein NusG